MTVNKQKLVSLLSNWFSGATLLTMLLARHSEIVSNGETMSFDEREKDRYDCTCGKYIDECEFYKATAAHMRLADGTGWDPRLFVHAPRFSDNLIMSHFLGSWRYESGLRDRFTSLVGSYRSTRDGFLDAQMRFFDNAMMVSGASIYLDGTKSIRRAQLLARSNRCDLKALHMIRDGRGFCLSYLKAHAAENPSKTPSVSDGARAWVRYIGWVDAFAKSFPSVPVLTVRYEDLCRSTTETIRAICGFLEIPYEEMGNGTSKDTHILGNRVRRNFNGTIVEDVAWRNTFDQRTQAKITAIMKTQLGRFGYV